MTDVGRRKLRAPREDGGVLIDRAANELPGVVGANIAERARWSLGLAGQSFGGFAATARAEFVAAATAYTRTYRDVSHSPLSASHSPLLLAGHQPELFHPGVWAKNFALSGLAAAVGGTAVNLVIDGDTLKAASLRVPTGSLREPNVESVPFDAPGDEIPFEERRVLDAAMFASFGNRVADALRPFVADPLLRSFWPDVVRQAKACGKLGLAIAQARHRLEGSWGLGTLELPQSHVCDSHHFRRFVGHLVAELPRFVEAHNSELEIYKRRENIRSANHPVPALEQEGDWLESPLWLWTVDQPRRRHVFVRRRVSEGGGREVELTDRAGLVLKLPLVDARHDDFAEALHEAARRGIRLRSRALLTTMYARVVLGDLFVHGIGGGKYDELTDAILGRFFAVAPPQFAVVTATRKLPIVDEAGRPAVEALSAVDEPTARHRLWELRHHPERFLHPADISNPAERETAAAAVAEKRRWTDIIPTAETARIRCQAIRAANETLQPLVAGEAEKWRHIAKESHAAGRVAELLRIARVQRLPISRKGFARFFASDSCALALSYRSSGSALTNRRDSGYALGQFSRRSFFTPKSSSPGCRQVIHRTGQKEVDVSRGRTG
ncbi:MAG: hypothetical protein QM775_00215 [Pirellulales bacterium]